MTTIGVQQVDAKIMTSSAHFTRRRRAQQDILFFAIVVSSVMTFLVFMWPDDASSRNGAGSAGGDSEHAPELAGKLGNHTQLVNRNVKVTVEMAEIMFKGKYGSRLHQKRKKKSELSGEDI